MIEVSFTKWYPGFIEVRFIKLLRESTGLSLSAAKHVADSLLSKEHASVFVPDMVAAENLLRQARVLGVEGRIEPSKLHPTCLADSL